MSDSPTHEPTTIVLPLSPCHYRLSPEDQEMLKVEEMLAQLDRIRLAALAKSANEKVNNAILAAYNVRRTKPN